ncbi:MAG: DinB family protein [Candidatus Pedobacter colombiensis]|uniref:DinB family protein n=1 Tax=Candidatus Pedobacter colombiensis TaxID=3121371 RepID=A0AAJ5W4K1_9SPHI|nr:DinB family protein [Pedobacter sp.]WEK17465.1 MAG: DinB family protein [Pedobacter sp.]
MTHTEIITLNFEEIRRRSIKLWTGLVPETYFWRPDIKAMSCLEMIRHVLEGEHLFHKILDNRGNIGDYVSPWKDIPYTNLQDELNFAKPYREKFLSAIKSFSADDLTSIEIVRSEKGQRRRLGDYLQRIAYHEAVHAGQLLSYFRTLGLDRPQIWD